MRTVVGDSVDVPAEPAKVCLAPRWPDGQAASGRDRRPAVAPTIFLKFLRRKCHWGGSPNTSSDV